MKIRIGRAISRTPSREPTAWDQAGGADASGCIMVTDGFELDQPVASDKGTDGKKGRQKQTEKHHRKQCIF